ncbi:DUF3050 domain-containing protein [Mangrovimonas futianensis]|uniref:DUF3050 domain-containing protein n=1 Tax=Mangrovimonas futianensis TaxID=2895523 RepID=UPI001E4B0450|nr:DUF3050 domain-containing protein [Mangrovimonas futianensis]MCF1420184.1 DUF3050 domain-containing protein [Mangrovimonas futianensis]
MKRIEFVEKELSNLRTTLNNHPVYKALSHMDDVKIFMEQHVFAVWDFMSLLKALQNQLTCTKTPWVPAQNATTARFINEIVLGEESDLDENGIPKSHFEMYLDAMNQIGANTHTIQNFIDLISKGASIDSSLNNVKIQKETADFINFTFDIIATGEPHKIASAFTFGREDVIPDMFFQIINQSQTQDQTYSKLTYYLKRHIELDGDEHGPLSLKMIEELCGDNDQKWQEVLEVAKEALNKRIELWNGISELINSNQLQEV